MLLKQSKYYFAAALLFSVSCSDFDRNPDSKIVARVNRVDLTEAEVNEALRSEKYNGSFRKEYIKNWIEKEILYKEAAENNVEDKEFEKIIEESKKELAVSFFLDKYFRENPVKYSEKDLQDFYNDNKSTYAINDDALVYNEVVFNDESKAILFRNTLLDSDWNRTMNVFRGDSSIKFSDENRFRFFSDLNSRKLLKILQVLNDGEVSIIFEESPGSFLILQVVHRLSDDEIPDLKYIRDQVVEDFLTLQKKALYNKLIISLYSKYNVEIK